VVDGLRAERGRHGIHDGRDEVVADPAAEGVFGMASSASRAASSTSLGASGSRRGRSQRSSGGISANSSSAEAMPKSDSSFLMSSVPPAAAAC